MSNGYAEDAVGSLIAQRLQRSGISVVAYPLVGLGETYGGVPLLDPRRALPSGGFGLRGSWAAMWADLRAGLLTHWLGQRDRLHRQRDRHSARIAIGDTFCLWMAGMAGAPVVYVATAKSEFNDPHRWRERRTIRRLAERVYARDEPTRAALLRAGLPARYVGNPLMDTIHFNTERLPHLKPGHGTVTLLPGSRADAYTNFPSLLRLCRRVAGQMDCNFLCAVAGSVDPRRLYAAATRTGWQVEGRALRSAEVEVRLTRAFAEAVQAADVVVGLAGTANEQAAGLGKPLVAFPGPGPQYTRRFLTLQARLLGNALIRTDGWPQAAEAVVQLLGDPQERMRRGEVGRRRMGEAGAVPAITDDIAALLDGASGAGR